MRFFSERSLESLRPKILFSPKITAADTTGPAMDPLPTSSTPRIILNQKDS